MITALECVGIDFNYQCSCRLVNGIIFYGYVKNILMVLFYRFSNTKLSLFQTLSLGLFLKNFADFSLDILVTYILVEKHRPEHQRQLCLCLNSFLISTTKVSPPTARR